MGSKRTATIAKKTTVAMFSIKPPALSIQTKPTAIEIIIAASIICRGINNVTSLFRFTVT